MNRKISFHPITRIEGHAKVTIYIDSEGKVKNTLFQVIEYRGFERILRNRPIEEAPLIVSRICGLCSPSHHLASVKTVDEIFKLEISEEDVTFKLRDLFHLAGILHSHLLHIFFLYLPDVLFEIKDVNSGFPKMLKYHMPLVKKVLEVRNFAKTLLEVLGGSSIHPSASVPGSFLNPMKPSQSSELLNVAMNSMRMLIDVVEMVEGKINENMSIEEGINIHSNFVALYSNSIYPLYHAESIHAISASGELSSSFKCYDYYKKIFEESIPWSYAKSPYLKDLGFYRVGPLARFNINKLNSENSKDFVERFLSKIQKPILSSNYYNLIRIAESIYVLDRIIELLNDEKITNTPVTHENLKIKRLEGIGVVEAPRGLLIHHYKVNGDGYIKDANLIVATVQNIPVIEREIAIISEKIISREGIIEDKLYREISKVIRNYDPCLSCATHKYDFPYTMEIHIENRGKIITYPKTLNSNSLTLNII
ncbi:MAG: Ni/Fe hydrogenase subunit alpha [Candidatus Methanomethylicia archaeon]|nr:Ni/Fe hydrogenase subunit alpha [Candidatus Methanomethylicia archaeon]MCX8169258.1 Ni/Fe hydrogenase subunit alpha [Candidatus Methanomethylicia archaeon]MDW7988960.1 Ni/Fe hydrogenase subunit alpha [Nitrososphaerota archaeon]